MGSKVASPFWSIFWVAKDWRGSTYQGWQGKSYSATKLILPEVDEHSGELPVHYREMQTHFFLKFGQRQIDIPHKFRNATNINVVLRLSSIAKVEKSLPDFFFHRLALGNKLLVLTKAFHKKNPVPPREIPFRDNFSQDG